MIFMPEEEKCAVIDNGENVHFRKLVITKFHFSCIILHHSVLDALWR